MGRSKSPWRFSADKDVAAASLHPFEGVPLHFMSELISADNYDVGNTGIVGYCNNFTRWEGPVAEGAAGGWTLSGPTGAATIVLGDVPSGTIVLTTDATGSAVATLHLGSATTGANFLYSIGKQIWCFTRVKLLTVASMEFFLGICTPDTSPCTTGTLPSDGIFLTKASSDTNLTLHARKDGTSTTKTLVLPTVLADDTYTTIGFRVLPNGAIMPYQNGTAITAKAIAAGSANIPTTGDILQFETGFLGASMTATYDWLMIAQEL